MGEVACQFVLHPELLFLEAVEKVFVGVSSMLFFVDQRVERGMLRTSIVLGRLPCPLVPILSAK